MTPPLFSALLMLAVTHNAFDMIEEVRGQFKANPEFWQALLCRIMPAV